MEGGSSNIQSTSGLEYPGTFIRTGTAHSRKNLSRHDSLASVGSRQSSASGRLSRVNITSATKGKRTTLVLVSSAKGRSRSSARPLTVSGETLPVVSARNCEADNFSEIQFFTNAPVAVPQKQKLSPEEEEERRHYAEGYRLVCRRLGVIPVSSLNEKMVTSDVILPKRGLGPQGTRALAVALVDNRRVEKLDVSGNDVGPTGCSCLAQLLSVNHRIMSLNLSENNIGHKGVSYITRSLRNRPSFVHLNLSGVAIGNRECSHLADLIKTSKSLEELNLSHNQIEDSGAVIIGKALVETECLKKLDLSWNLIRGQGGAAIGRALRGNGSLCEVNVAWNGFAKKGCQPLGEALASNERLRDLDLRCNRITDAGLAEVIKGLKNNIVLKSIKLSLNSISAEMALLLLKTIEANEDSSLKFIDLQDAAVSVAFVHMLRRMRRVRDIEVLHGVVLRSSASPIDCTNGYYPGNTGGGGQMNLVSLIFRLMEKEKLRVVDVFRRLDTDDSDTITKQEFRDAVKKYKFEITPPQLDDIVQVLDADDNGKISLEELLKGEREYKKSIREKINKRKMELDEKAQISAGID